AARPNPRSHPPGPRGGRSRARGIIPPVACGLRTADPLSRRLAPCPAASRAARRGRGDACLSDAHLGHHPGLRGRATRRHRLALAHRDGRRAHGCAMAFDRRAYRPARARDVIPFMNAHYVYALARAGRADAVEAALAGVRARSAADDEEAKRVWAPVGRAVIEAVAAFGTGDRARAAALLDPVMPMMTSI